MQQAIFDWWAECLKRREVPLDLRLRNTSFCREPRAGYLFWPKLLCRRVLYQDFCAYSRMDVTENEFYVVMSRWLYPYGKDHQLSRREVYISMPGVHSYQNVRQQKYFIRMAEPDVLNAVIGTSTKFDAPLGGKTTQWLALLKDEELRHRCLRTTGEALTNNSAPCLDLRTVER